MSVRKKFKPPRLNQVIFDACVEVLRDHSDCTKDVAKKVVEKIINNYHLAQLVPEWLLEPDGAPIRQPKLKSCKAAKKNRSLKWPPHKFAGGKWRQAREKLEELEYHLFAASWTLRQLDPDVFFDLEHHTQGNVLSPAEVEDFGLEGPSLALDMEHVAAQCAAVYKAVDRPKGGAQERDFEKILFIDGCKQAWETLCDKPAQYSEGSSAFREFIEYAWEATTGNVPTASEFDRSWNYLRKNKSSA